MFPPPEEVAKEFRFVEAGSTSGSLEVVLNQVPIVLATLTLPEVDPKNRHWLMATIGWQAKERGIGAGHTDVLFSIRLDSPVGPVVYDLRASADPTFERVETTTLNHVDTHVFKQPITYYLVGEAPLYGSKALVIGPLTFTGLILAQN